MTPLIERLRLEHTRTLLASVSNRSCWVLHCLKHHKQQFSSISQRPYDYCLSFLRHKCLNDILFTWVRTGSGTTSPCMIYTNCEIKNVFIIQTLPAMLRLLFSHALIILLMFSTLPVQFSSTWEAHLSRAKYTPRILSLLFHTFDTNQKKVSVQFCLLPSHIASDFIRFISRPENVENSAKISNTCCISRSSLKTTLNGLRIVQLLILSKRPFLAFR